MNTYIINGERYACRTDAQAVFLKSLLEKSARSHKRYWRAKDFLYQKVIAKIVGEVSPTGYERAISVVEKVAESFYLHRVLLRKSAEEAAQFAKAYAKDTSPAVRRAVEEAIEGMSYEVI